jgi:hypothetical protein
MKTDKLYFNVHVPLLLNEIADNALRPNMGVLKIPLNQFRILLLEVADRAINVNDPELNILMLRMALYEGTPTELSDAINEQKRRIKK